MQGSLFPCNIPLLQKVPEYPVSFQQEWEIATSQQVGVFFFPRQAGKQFSFWEKKIGCHSVLLTDARTHITTLAAQNQ